MQLFREHVSCPSGGEKQSERPILRSLTAPARGIRVPVLFYTVNCSKLFVCLVIIFIAGQYHSKLEFVSSSGGKWDDGKMRVQDAYLLEFVAILWPLSSRFPGRKSGAIECPSSLHHFSRPCCLVP